MRPFFVSSAGIKIKDHVPLRPVKSNVLPLFDCYYGGVNSTAIAQS